MKLRHLKQGTEKEVKYVRISDTIMEGIALIGKRTT